MAGYDHDLGMSNNAVDAYCDGRKPISQIDIDDLRDAGWSKTKKLALFLAQWNFWRSFEWHHTGGTWYNEVKFYDPNDLVEKWDELSPTQQQEWQDKAKQSKTIKAAEVRVSGKYAEWGGSRSRPKIVGYVEFEGVLIGNWITTDKGTRKKANGKWINYKKIEEVK